MLSTTPSLGNSQSALLQTILGDITVDSFLRDDFGKRFIPLPGPGGRFSHLLTWADLNRVLETQAFSKGTLQMTKEAAEVPSDSILTEYTRLGRPTIYTKISSRKITDELRDGATLIINEIQKSVPRIATLAESLEGTLDARINVNMYLSLYEKHGFACHYDTHDVLILQIHGRKHWQVFGPRAVTPLSHESFYRDERVPVKTPVWDELLTEGDALYLPRGFWHFAEPVGEPTLHLTVGIVRPTGFDVLNWMVQQLSRSEVFRKDVPQSQHADLHQPYLTELCDAIKDFIAPTDLLTRYQNDRAIAENAMPQQWRGIKFGLPWSATQEGLPDSPSAVIHITAPFGLKIHTNAESPDTIALYHEGKMALHFRNRVEPLCEFLTQRAPVTMEQFLSQFRVEFGEAVLRDFLRQLVLKGLVVLRLPEAEASPLLIDSATEVPTSG
jgi:Cupin superfamily protein